MRPYSRVQVLVPDPRSCTASPAPRSTSTSSVDLRGYTVVDVSAEPDDGDPGHSSDSVLRGRLRS